MYTESERQLILDEIVRKAELDQRVLSLILVGSGASGFNDLLSDLDLVAVLEDSQFDEAGNELSSWIAQRWVPSHSKLYQHAPKIHVWCYLLPNCLNIDIGLWSEKALFASKPHWKILFDRTDTFESKLNTTWKPPVVASFESLATDSVSWVWQPVRTALTALKRGEHLKAAFHMNLLRQEVIKLYAAKAGQTPENLNSIQQGELMVMLEPDLATTFSSYCSLLEELQVPNITRKLEAVRYMYSELDQVRLT